MKYFFTITYTSNYTNCTVDNKSLSALCLTLPQAETSHNRFDLLCLNSTVKKKIQDRSRYLPMISNLMKFTFRKT